MAAYLSDKEEHSRAVREAYYDRKRFEARIAELEACRSVLAQIMADPRGRGIDPEHRRQARTALAAATKSDKR